MLLWLACSCHAEALEVATGERRDWPESTALHYLWTAGEDYILQAITSAVLLVPTKHLSLHFDGIMVDDARVGDHSGFQDYIQRHVEEKTGYKINIRRKESFSWFS